MIGADLALAQLINRTADAYQNSAPAYITYRETTKVTAPSLGRSQEINRSVAVRVADNYAVMQDLPRGAQRTGEAFPIIPYFDPFSQFGFSWFANLKRIDITLKRGSLGYFPIPPPDPSVSVVVPYASFWTPTYLPDSVDSRVDIAIAPTSAYGSGLYTSHVLEDGQTHLPAQIDLRDTASDETISLYYHVLDGHWVITRGTFTSTQHFGPLRFTVIADTTYHDMTFPQTPPDPRLAGTPAPTPTP